MISARNLISSIDASRTRGLQRVLIGLSIRHVGPIVALALTRAFPDIAAVIAATPERLSVIDGVGGVIGESVVGAPEGRGVDVDGRLGQIPGPLRGGEGDGYFRVDSAARLG